jgi:hypothetical protein
MRLRDLFRRQSLRPPPPRHRHLGTRSSRWHFEPRILLGAFAASPWPADSGTNSICELATAETCLVTGLYTPRLG